MRPTLPIAFALALAACDEERITFTDGAAFVDAATDIAPTAPGAACGTNEQGEPLGGCSAGQYCVSPQEGFPNGYCAPDCRVAPCPAGSVCYPASTLHHYCLRGCARDSDCRVREGYVCRTWNPGFAPGCIPNDEPVGRRDGRACFATDSDGGVGPFLAPLPAVRFTSPSVGLSRAMLGTEAEAEPSIALDGRGGAVVSFMGVDTRSYWRGGVVRIAPDGSASAPLIVHDYDYPNVYQPTVAFDRAGTLHLVYVADFADRPGNFLRHTVSHDGGATVERAVSVFTDIACGLGCNAPVLAVGPDGTGDAVYAGAVGGRRDGSTVLSVARRAVDAAAFDLEVVIAALEVDGMQRRAPGIAALSAGPVAGEVTAAWVMRNLDNAQSSLGDRINRVRVRSSTDGGRTWGETSDATRAGDAPVAQVPWVARAAGVTHVVYVTGGVLGVWDVVLATRRDGASAWQHRVVNDDPERCATHAFAGLAVDGATGDAFVLWLDNRYDQAVAAAARCPADASQRCERNERVPGEPFVLSTTHDPLRWHGTRSALALAPDGALFAAWSDTRTGGPGVYLARGRAAP
mgnify:CR=1 FL=1